MGTNYIAPIWRMPRNANKDNFSNYSINFAGGTEYINCGTDSTIQFQSTFSISCWVKTSNTSQNKFIIHRGVHYSETFQDYRLLITSAGNAQLRVNNNSYSVTSTETNLDDGNWHHIVAICDLENTDGYIYVDNSTPTTNPSFPSSLNLNTGYSTYISSPGGSYDMIGEMSQICVFDYALSTDQIGYLYNLNNPMAITGAEPIAYWPLGDNSNPNAPGSFPNISVGADSVFQFDGAIGGALINVGNDSSLNITDSLSVSAWFKTLHNSDTIMIATKDNGGASRAWQLYMHSTGAIRFGINGVTALATSSGVYDDGNWHHVLGVYEPSSYVKLYIDGLEDGEDTTSVPASINSLPSQDVVIGGYDGYDAAGGRRWDGELSNIQIWDTDLQLSDAQTLYNNGQPLMTGTQPQAANLKAWYKLNQHDSYWDIGGNGAWTFNNAALN